MNKIKVFSFFIIALLLAVISFFILNSYLSKTKKSIEIKSKEKENNAKVLSVSNTDDKAPEIKNKGKWINSVKELSLSDLNGKVILIEFWTFGCYNCKNTIPYLNQWYEKYKSDSFEMIGVHCPEFDNEKKFENVKQSIKELSINYSVLIDNEFMVWDRYDVHAWPTIFLIDKKGEIRYKKVGEGKYDKTDEMINILINENDTAN